MKNYGLLSISLLASAFGTVAKKYYTDKSDAGIIAKCNYTASSFLVAAACIAFVGDMTMPSFFTVLLSLAFGVVTALQGVAMLLAMRIGPVSYTMMFASFSTVITALSGTLFFDERLTLLKVFGIALMLISFVFATENGAEALHQKLAEKDPAAAEHRKRRLGEPEGLRRNGSRHQAGCSRDPVRPSGYG